MFDLIPNLIGYFVAVIAALFVVVGAFWTGRKAGKLNEAERKNETHERIDDADQVDDADAATKWLSKRRKR